MVEKRYDPELKRYVEDSPGSRDPHIVTTGATPVRQRKVVPMPGMSPYMLVVKPDPDMELIQAQAIEPPDLREVSEDPEPGSGFQSVRSVESPALSDWELANLEDEPRLLPPKWVEITKEIPHTNQFVLPPALDRWWRTGPGKNLLDQTGWLLWISDKDQEDRVLAVMSEVDIVAGDILALDYVWSQSEPGTPARFTLPVTGGTMRLTRTEMTKIWLGALYQRALFTVLPQSILAMVPKE